VLLHSLPLEYPGPCPYPVLAKLRLLERVPTASLSFLVPPGIMLGSIAEIGIAQDTLIVVVSVLVSGGSLVVVSLLGVPFVGIGPYSLPVMEMYQHPIGDAILFIGGAKFCSVYFAQGRWRHQPQKENSGNYC
jgi:hypothetical protein